MKEKRVESSREVWRRRWKENVSIEVVRCIDGQTGGNCVKEEFKMEYKVRRRLFHE